jgi:hypothetical protein
MSKSKTDLWDVRVTLRCRLCGKEETDRYASLMHADHWPLDHDTSVNSAYRLAYCPRCVGEKKTPVRLCGYGRWRM